MLTLIFTHVSGAYLLNPVKLENLIVLFCRAHIFIHAPFLMQISISVSQILVKMVGHASATPEDSSAIVRLVSVEKTVRVCILLTFTPPLSLTTIPCTRRFHGRVQFTWSISFTVARRSGSIPQHTKSIFHRILVGE